MLRNPKKTIAGLVLVFCFAMASLGMGLIKFNFFASDPVRLFYVNVEMPSGTSVEETLRYSRLVEQKLANQLPQRDVRAL